MARGDFVGLEVQGVEELERKFSKLTPAVQDQVVEDDNQYLLNVLRAYPSYKYVSRKQAYGVTFFTDKQRRYFFAALADGRIQVPYHRTQDVRRKWLQYGTGRRSFLANESDHAPFLYNDDQSRMAGMIGWKKLTQTLKERTAQLIRIAESAAKKAIKKVGL